MLDSIFDYLTKSLASNIEMELLEHVLTTLIENIVINKKTPTGLSSFRIADDSLVSQNEVNNLIENNQEELNLGFNKNSPLANYDIETPFNFAGFFCIALFMLHYLIVALLILLCSNVSLFYFLLHNLMLQFLIFHYLVLHHLLLQYLMLHCFNVITFDVVLLRIALFMWQYVNIALLFDYALI